MSDTINQTLGFDASQAIASIGNLNKSLSTMAGKFRAAEQNITKFNTAGAALLTNLARIEQEAAATALTVGSLTTRLADASRTAQGLGRSLPGLANKFVNLASGANSAAAGIGRINSGHLADVTKDASQAAAAMNKFNAATKAAKAPATPGASRSNNVVSWQTIGRVLQTQALLRTLGAITEGFHYAAESAVEFSQKVAEIRTISTIKDLGELKKQVADLATEFNRPLTDVAEGYYQTLSNQVGNAAESTKFLSTALKFGKVAVTETGDAVNVLAGTLHAFNRPVEDAGDFAAKLFKAIELGRVRGSELAETLGRVATVSQQLGLSFDEVLATVDLLGTKGIKATEATTQLSGAMQALIKPSHDGSKALAQLGYESGPAAVRALGFQGALKAIVGTTDGSATAISRLVPRVRGLTAVLALTAKDATFYADSLNAIKAASEQTLNTEFLRQMSTDAERVTKELNALKIFLTKDLGDAILAQAKNVLTLAGGAENLSLAIKHLLPLIELAGASAVTAAGAYGAWRLGTLALAVANGKLAASFGVVAGGAVGIVTAAVAAYQGIEYLIEKQELAWQHLQKDRIDSEEKSLEIGRKAASQRISLLEDESRQTEAIIAQRAASVEQAYDAQIAAAKTANDSLVENTQTAFDKLIHINDAYLGQLRRKIDEEKRLRESVKERLDEDRREKAKADFEQSLIGKPEKEQAFALTDAGVNSAREARDLRSNPNATREDLKAADRKDRESKDFFRQAEQIGQHLQQEGRTSSTRIDRLGKGIEVGQEGLALADAKGANRQARKENTADAKADRQAQLQQWRASQAALSSFNQKNRKFLRPGGVFASGNEELDRQYQQLQAAAKQRPIQRKQDDLAAEQQKQAQLQNDAGSVEQRLGAGRKAALEANEAGGAAQIANSEQRQAAEDAAAVKRQGIVEELRDLKKEFSKNKNLFDAKGELLPEDVRQEHAKRRHAATTKALELGLDSGDDNLNKEIADFQAAVSKELSDEEIKKLRVDTAALLDVSDQIQSFLNDKTFSLRAKVDFENAGGSTRLHKLEADQQNLEAQQQSAAAYAKQSQRALGQANLPQRPTGWGQDLGDLYADGLNQALGLNGKRGGYKEREQEFREIKKQLTLLTNHPETANAESLTGVENRLKRLIDPDEFGTGSKGFASNRGYVKLQESLDALKRGADAREKLAANEFAKPEGAAELEKLRHDQRKLENDAKRAPAPAAPPAEQNAASVQNQARDVGNNRAAELRDVADRRAAQLDFVGDQLRQSQRNGDSKEIERLSRRYDALRKEVEATGQAAQAAEREAKSVAQTTGPAQRIAQFAQYTANGYERAAIAIGKIRPPKAPDALQDPNDVSHAAYGGTIRRFAFGGAVGTDTIPAMLSPGEMVWSAQASRSFAAQLTAINAGSNPPASYGSVTHNTTIGDVNITVPGGPTNAQTARQLAAMTRRELRLRG